jgi:hypothetical protein
MSPASRWSSRINAVWYCACVSGPAGADGVVVVGAEVGAEVGVEIGALVGAVVGEVVAGSSLVNVFLSSEPPQPASSASTATPVVMDRALRMKFPHA